MATGDTTVFEEFALDIGSEKHNLPSGNDVIKIALVDATITPTAADATPTWSDYSANEVSTAGGYTAGGETLASSDYTEVGGVGKLDGTDFALSQNGAGFTDAFWAIIYNSTEAGGAAIAFVELGGPVSEVAGPININWNAAGILTVTVT